MPQENTVGLNIVMQQGNVLCQTGPVASPQPGPVRLLLGQSVYSPPELLGAACKPLTEMAYSNTSKLPISAGSTIRVSAGQARRRGHLNRPHCDQALVPCGHVLSATR